jgi:predicted phage gp36 major capsid-like protein
MAKGKKKNFTVDDLAFMVENGFTELRTEMREGFDDMEKDMMKMRDDIRAVDSKVSGIWNVIDQHADRLKRLEMMVLKK